MNRRVAILRVAELQQEFAHAVEPVRLAAGTRFTDELQNIGLRLGERHERLTVAVHAVQLFDCDT